MARSDKAVGSNNLKSGICKGKRVEKHRGVFLGSLFSRSRLPLILRDKNERTYPVEDGFAHFRIRTFDFFRSTSYNGRRTTKEERQMEQKYDMALTSQEWRLIIESLNRLRNQLIAEGRYTDAVDELLIKVVNAKVKKHRLWGWRS
jgi:hypothetical protein